MSTIKIKNFNIGNDEKFVLISGPCVIESYDLCAEVCEKLKIVTFKKNIPYIFKASFLKDNRTASDSFRGPGIDEGLKILDKIKNEFDVPILTDIHHPEEAKIVAEVCELLQIPAFLSRQTSLLEAAAETGKIVNVKKAQFMAPTDMENVIDKLKKKGNNKILLTERGTVFGYNNLVVDFRGMLIMKKTGFPVIYDVTHSLQQPSLGKISGGTPEFVPAMAKAGLSLGIAGLFIETHPKPEKALSDAKSMIPLEKLILELDNMSKIDEAVKL